MVKSLACVLYTQWLSELTVAQKRKGWVRCSHAVSLRAHQNKIRGPRFSVQHVTFPHPDLSAVTEVRRRPGEKIPASGSATCSDEGNRKETNRLRGPGPPTAFFASNPETTLVDLEEPRSCRSQGSWCPQAAVVETCGPESIHWK